ncbi:MAG: hypothetical protein ABI200_00910 [Gaiellales bacterium]
MQTRSAFSSVRADAAQVGAHRDQLIGGVLGSATLGLLGAAFSWKVDRVPRLAATAALTGAVAGALGGAILRSGSPLGDSASMLQRAGGGALLGGAAGAVLLGGIAGVVLPPLSAVKKIPAMREFALYGGLVAGAIGAVIGAVTRPSRHRP